MKEQRIKLFLSAFASGATFVSSLLCLAESQYLHAVLFALLSLSNVSNFLRAAEEKNG